MADALRDRTFGIFLLTFLILCSIYLQPIFYHERDHSWGVISRRGFIEKAVISAVGVFTALIPDRNVNIAPPKREIPIPSPIPTPIPTPINTPRPKITLPDAIRA